MKLNSRRTVSKLVVMAVLVLIAAILYLIIDVNFENQRLFRFAMKLRFPKLIVMLITAFAIGGASIVFQSVIIMFLEMMEDVQS